MIARILAAAALLSPSPAIAAAAEILVEAQPVAQRLVLVAPTDFASRERLETVRDRLRKAARAVCREQHPAETTYYHSRACYSGTASAALGELRRLEAKLAQFGSPASAQVAILVRPR